MNSLFTTTKINSGERDISDSSDSNDSDINKGKIQESNFEHFHIIHDKIPPPLPLNSDFKNQAEPKNPLKVFFMFFN